MRAKLEILKKVVRILQALINDIEAEIALKKKS